MGEGRRRQAAGVAATTGHTHPRARALLAEAWLAKQAGRLAAAKAAFEGAIRIDSGCAEAWRGLGLLAADAGARDAAVNILARAAALAPGDFESRALYAKALQHAGREEAACGEWRAICERWPEDSNCWESLGILQQAIGNAEDAAQAYRRAETLRPSPGLRTKLATLVSPIAPSRQAIGSERRRMETALDEMLASGTGGVLDDPMRAGLWTNFYLAYHGLGDRALQTKTAALYRRLLPSLEYVAAHCKRPRAPGGRVRVGLISRFFHNHSIGRTSRGLFARLSRDAFDVTAIFIAPTVDDEYARFIQRHAARSVVVPQDLVAARRLIEALQLDILFYQDIGMEPFSYFLAFSRLAPVQCVSFGHPDTTGIPAMDVFISNDLYETPAAATHYSERLFLLRGLGSLAYYYRPELPARRKGRADFGLAERETIYLCPQNLFKIHPDMDDLIAGILRRDPGGRVVLIEGKIGHWTDLLRQRWRESMADVMDRVLFLPRMPAADYVNLIALADVMLDTVHFNGMNTSLEAFSVGTPVVTWPGEFQRGRHTQAMYRRMGLSDGIAASAEDYIDIAVRLGADAGCRNALRAQIIERSGCLFEDGQVVIEFERFFREATASRGAA